MVAETGQPQLVKVAAGQGYQLIRSEDMVNAAPQFDAEALQEPAALGHAVSMQESVDPNVAAARPIAVPFTKSALPSPGGESGPGLGQTKASVCIVPLRRQAVSSADDW